MKIAYTALVILTVVVGTRFAREFTAAVQGSRDATREALDRGPYGQTQLPSAGSVHAHRNPLPRTGQFAFEPSASTALSTLTATAGPTPDPVAAPEPVPDASSRSIEPRRHAGARHDDLLLPGDFTYLGAFRPPHVEGLASSFSYGGAAVAFNPHGDPNGNDDGYPGSLFLVGHIYDQLVAEISIPRPVISPTQTADDLKAARILQSFGDISGGLQRQLTTSESQPYRFGGLHVTGDALHWTLFRYYNVEGYDFHSHGRSTLNLSQPAAKGPWHLGPFQSGDPQWHAYKHAGYVCDAPQSVVAQLEGCELLSGLQISTGLQTSSQGPALFAYHVADDAPQPGTSLDAIPLLWYSMERPLDGHHPADSWTGAAWLELGHRQSVVFIGRKATGPVYYGEGRPQDCSENKGYHGPPYEVQAVFYSPGDLIDAARNERPAFDIQPVHRWTGQSAGGGLTQYMFPTCEQSLGGLAYDRANNLLYLVQLEAGITKDSPYEPLPLIHVFRIGG